MTRRLLNLLTLLSLLHCVAVAAPWGAEGGGEIPGSDRRPPPEA